LWSFAYDVVLSLNRSSDDSDNDAYDGTGVVNNDIGNDEKKEEREEKKGVNASKARGCASSSRKFVTKRIAWRSDEANRLMIALDDVYWNDLKTTNASAFDMRYPRGNKRSVCKRPVPSASKNPLPSWILAPGYKQGDKIPAHEFDRDTPAAVAAAAEPAI
jgi:hypothetical protein